MYLCNQKRLLMGIEKISRSIKKNSIYLKAKFNLFAYRFISEPEPEKWVFIVGCYNSGSTLLHKILASHPKIGSMPLEGRQFTDELPLAEDFGLKRLWALQPELFYLDETTGLDIDVNKIKRQWAFMYNNPKKPILIEKSIINGGRTRWLQRHFQNSYFIILMRNGYVIAEGIRRKANHSIEKGIIQWKNSYDILLRDMAHLKNKIYLTYENLTADPKTVLNTICDFLEIEHLSENILTSEFKVHERENKISNFNQKSIDNLSKEDIDSINRIAGSLLQQVGYPILLK